MLHNENNTFIYIACCNAGHWKDFIRTLLLHRNLPRQNIMMKGRGVKCLGTVNNLQFKMEKENGRRLDGDFNCDCLNNVS